MTALWVLAALVVAWGSHRATKAGERGARWGRAAYLLIGGAYLTLSLVDDTAWRYLWMAGSLFAFGKYAQWHVVARRGAA